MSCLWMEDDEANEEEIIGNAGLGFLDSGSDCL
jgi:hypothetical protein